VIFSYNLHSAPPPVVPVQGLPMVEVEPPVGRVPGVPGPEAVHPHVDLVGFPILQSKMKKLALYKTFLFFSRLKIKQSRYGFL
jgi:hypothetical protein